MIFSWCMEGMRCQQNIKFDKYKFKTYLDLKSNVEDPKFSSYDLGCFCFCFVVVVFRGGWGGVGWGGVGVLYI